MGARHLAVAALAALLLACAEPVPQARMEYVGDWWAPEMSVSISAAGRVHYIRRTGNASRSISAPLKEFDGDDFIVGVGPLNTRFKVSSPPHRAGGAWKMTVDGIELTRRAAGLNANADSRPARQA